MINVFSAIYPCVPAVSGQAVHPGAALLVHPDFGNKKDDCKRNTKPGYDGTILFSGTVARCCINQPPVCQSHLTAGQVLTCPPLTKKGGTGFTLSSAHYHVQPGLRDAAFGRTGQPGEMISIACCVFI
jgi:hypothetical protein